MKNPITDLYWRIVWFFRTNKLWKEYAEECDRLWAENDKLWKENQELEDENYELDERLRAADYYIMDANEKSAEKEILEDKLRELQKDYDKLLNDYIEVSDRYTELVINES